MENVPHMHFRPVEEHLNSSCLENSEVVGYGHSKIEEVAL